MDFRFISALVAFAGLFGLAFVIFAVLQKRSSNQRSRQRDHNNDRHDKQSSGKQGPTKKGPIFHPCAAPGCSVNIAGQDLHGWCFSCLTMSHNMNTCDVCLMTKPSGQQCRAIRLYLWNLPLQSLPDLVNNTDSGLKRLAVHAGSIDKARRWLSQWTLDYMDHKASCISQFVVVSSLQDDPLAIPSSSGSLPPASQGIPLSAMSIGGEPQQSSASILLSSLPILVVHSDAAGSHLPSGECAPATALPLLDHQSLLSDLPPPEDTLFQVVAQEEVVGLIESTALAVAGPLSEGAAIQAVFD